MGKVKRTPAMEILNDSLPADAIQKGYGLVWWNPDMLKEDPVILYNRTREVFRWNYTPSLTEVREKIEELESPRKRLANATL